jgi:hypothetical protein
LIWEPDMVCVELPVVFKLTIQEALLLGRN